MKQLFLLLFLIMLSFHSFGEEAEHRDYIILKKGDPVPFDGVMVEEGRFRELVQKFKEYQILLEWYNKLDENLAAQILELETPIDLLKQQIILKEEKYNLEKALRMDFQENYYKVKAKSDVLVITNAVGWGIGISSLLGVGVYLLRSK